MIVIYGNHYLGGIANTIDKVQLTVPLSISTVERDFLLSLKKSNNLIGCGVIVEKFNKRNRKLLFETVLTLRNILAVSKSQITLCVLYQDKKFLKYIMSLVGHRRLKVFGYKFDKDMLSQDNISLELLSPIIENQYGIYHVINTRRSYDSQERSETLDVILKSFVEHREGIVELDIYKNASKAEKLFIDNLIKGGKSDV